MSTENKPGLFSRLAEKAGEKSQEVQEALGRKINERIARASKTVKDRGSNEVVDESKAEDTSESQPKKSLSERAKEAVSSTAEFINRQIDRIDSAREAAKQSANKFAENVAIGWQLVKDAGEDIGKAGKEAIERIKNTPKWVAEGTVAAVKALEERRKQAGEKLKADYESIKGRASRFGLNIRDGFNEQLNAFRLGEEAKIAERKKASEEAKRLVLQGEEKKIQNAIALLEQKLLTKQSHLEVQRGIETAASAALAAKQAEITTALNASAGFFRQAAMALRGKESSN